MIIRWYEGGSDIPIGEEEYSGEISFSMVFLLFDYGVVPLLHDEVERMVGKVDTRYEYYLSDD